ncbi:MAG TPA: PIN domain-containing protein [Candidatus Saccharimonadales bacterium]|nr:PIN domain-containing protein [Candidatus Saccharimonadales bacterium]
MKSFIIDTNGFLRLLLNDIPIQADKVEDLIRKAKAGHISIIIPDIVLFEIDFVLEKYYLLTKDDVIEKLQSLVSAPYFTVTSRDVFLKALLFYKYNAVSFVDCFLAANAQLENMELFTFDQKLQKLK